MKTRIRQAAIAALATGLVAGTLQSATLRGRVRTADGEALKARVTVLARSSGVNLTTYDTGEDGTFSIDLPATGAVAASASAAGYSSHEIDLTDGAPSGSVTFTLEALREMRRDCPRRRRQRSRRRAGSGGANRHDASVSDLPTGGRT